jgi:uncharacterized protein DUF397
MIWNGFCKSTHCQINSCVEVGAFRKSSHSAQGNCVEVGAFRKSSHSVPLDSDSCLEAGIFQKSSHSNDYDACLEAGVFGYEVRIADTTQRDDPHRPVLAVSPAAWQAFIDTLK